MTASRCVLKCELKYEMVFLVVCSMNTRPDFKITLKSARSFLDLMYAVINSKQLMMRDNSIMAKSSLS
jgi:hypothetical protein